MVIRGAKVFDTLAGKFYNTSVKIHGGVISEIGDSLSDSQITDADGAYLIPGLIDIHTHGAIGVDAVSADSESICRMSEFYASNGVTTVFPALATVPHEKALKAISEIVRADKKGAKVRFRGVHIEGQFLSFARKGAHNPDYLRNPDIKDFLEYKEACDGRSLYVTVAGELEGALNAIAQGTREGIRFSIGHSDATCDEALYALRAGAVSFTHLYNAMSPLNHREPGCVGAALMSDAMTEIIADGQHVHPDTVKLTYKIKGSDRLVLVSDSLESAGLPDGEYMSAGLRVIVKDGLCRLEDGTIAGSNISLFEAVKNLMRFAQISFENALLCATRNPAICAGIYNEVGSVQPGKAADLVLVSPDMEIASTISDGEIVYKR